MSLTRSDRNASKRSLKPLSVRVNDELVLDGGFWEEAPDYRSVHPPAKTMFDQVIDYLSTKPPTTIGTKSDIGEEAVAATAVCLRWGSYLAILADREKPQWSKTRDARVSRIDDSEMRRINIEASSAFASWVELMRADPKRHRQLVRLAVDHLPMAMRRIKVAKDPMPLFTLAQPEIATRLAAAVQPEFLEKARVHAQAYPTRILANGIINYCWRNGPIEDIHAGQSSDYPLTRRRITSTEEKILIREIATRLTQGMAAVSSIIYEESERGWYDRVLPFHLAPYWRVTPTNWSLEKSTCDLQLPGHERLDANKDGRNDE